MKKIFKKIHLSSLFFLLVVSVLVSPLSTQIHPAFAAPGPIFRIQTGLVYSDSLTTGDYSYWSINGSAGDPEINAPRSVTEDSTGMHIGTVAPAPGVWAGWFAVSPNTAARLFHATIKLPNATPQTGLYDAAIYVQQQMAQDPRIDAMGCGADVFPTESHWTVSLQAGDATHELINQSIYTDTSPNQPTTRECTLVTNGSNQLTAYIDGQKVFSSNKMNLNMPEPFQYYLEIQTNSDTPSVGTQFIPTFTDYYATTSDMIKVKNSGANSVVRVINATSGAILSSSTADSGGTALVDVGRYHMPINAIVRVLDSSGTNVLAESTSPVGIYGGDIFNVGSATIQQAAITVDAIGMVVPVVGIYTTITKGAFSDFGFTPVTFSGLSQDAPYIVATSNFETHLFDHWEDGSRISGRVYTPTTPTATITAFYRESTVTNPPISLTSVTQYTTNINPPTIIGTAQAGSSVRLYDGLTAIGSPVTASPTGQWSITPPTLSSGSHLFSATAAVGGNVSPKSSPITMTIDQVIPSIQITGNSESNSRVTLTGTSSDAGSGIKVVEISIDNSATVKATPVVAADWSSWTFTTGPLALGTHHFIARATDLATNQNIDTDDVTVSNTHSTTTTISSNRNPSVFGQSVTFTATVTGAGGTPSGTVTFYDGATTLGTGTLAAGSTTLSTTTLGGGVHSITAVYSGDANFNTSTSQILTQTVSKGGTTTAVTSSINPTVFGQSITFTATVSAVAPASGTRTGTVTFHDGATIIGSGTLASGIATLSTTTLGGGSHSITAVYGGDVNFNTSTSPAITQTVTKGTTTTAVVSNHNPANSHQSIMFTATVSAVAPSSGTRTGTVTFFDGATTLGTDTLAGGTATFSSNTLSGGTHSISASYGGDANFNTSTSTTLTQIVTKAGPSIEVTSSLNPSGLNQSVTFTANVTGAGGTPTGDVTFFDGATILGNDTLIGGIATFTTATLVGGPHNIAVSYPGDGFFNPSTSPVLTQTVNKFNTTTAVTSNLNPSVFGQSVTFTATVSLVVPATGTRTGTVTFFDGATNLGTGSIASNTATLSTTTLGGGAHSITAVYSGDANFNTSTSPILTQTVNKGGTTTVVTSSVNPSDSGQSVTFTATISPVSPSSGTRTGDVTFFDGATNLGTGTIFANATSFTTSLLAAGSHSITGVYSGDSNFTTSTSPAITQTVNSPAPGSTTTIISSNSNPSGVDQSITFTATVTSSSGTPTGIVTFFDGATTLGTGTISGGSASYTTTLALGPHSITAVYSATSQFLSSTSPVLNQMVSNVSNCVPPSSGDWVVSSSCTLSSSSIAPANVIVQNNSKLTIPAGMSLDIDFVHYHLLVKSGSGVLVESGAKIF